MINLVGGSPLLKVLVATIGIFCVACVAAIAVRLIRRLKVSNLTKNVFAVASGTAAGQAIAFAFSPIITRIYSPEVFGLQGVFLALVGVLTPFIALRFPMAIIVADDDVEARQLGRLSMRIGFVLSSILVLILLIARENILTLLKAEALGHLIWFLPIALLCVAAQDVASFHAARKARFRKIGIATTIQAFLTNLARVLAGLAAPVAAALVTVTSFAPALQAALLKFGGDREHGPDPQLSKSETLTLLRKHRDFPLYRVPTDVLNSTSQSLPVLMLAALFSPAAAGLYTLTRSVLNLPSNLIGAAIGNVLYSHYAELDRDRRPLIPPLLRWTAGLLALAPPIVGLAWFAPPIFAFVFGEEWREAGRYAQWMSLWIGISIANIPAIRLAPVINSQMLLLIANGALLGLRAIAILLAYWSGGGAIEAVAAFSFASLAGNIGLTGAIILATNRYDRKRRQII